MINTAEIAKKGDVLRRCNKHGYKAARDHVHLQMANGTYKIYSDEYYTALEKLYNSHLAVYHKCGDHFERERSIIDAAGLDLEQIVKDHEGDRKERNIRFEADKLTQYIKRIGNEH